MERRSLSYVLDTSVILKWFFFETFSDKAILFQSALEHEKIRVVVPDLHLYELSNALRYKQFTVNTQIRTIEELLDTGIDIVVPTQELLQLAITVAEQFSISIYDACFVALSVIADCDLVTADMKLYRKIRGYFNVQLLQEL